jgi:hypothetical protein
MKKHSWLIAGTTLSLFFIGFLLGPTVLRWTGIFIGEEFISYSFSEFLLPPVSLGLLLAFCSICAGCFLWAYSRTNSYYSPILVFVLGLLISLVTAAVAIGYKLLYTRHVLHIIGEDLNNIPMSMDGVNYFLLGFRLVLFVNVVIIAVLLWFSHQRQNQSDNAPVHNN